MNCQPLTRFLKAQDRSYEAALSEVKAGQKTSHWMWYVFPQLKGLGFSERANHYAIKDTDEARKYLNHPTLGSRLRQITNALLNLGERDANKVFGNDALKFHACMTLFALVDTEKDSVFKKALDKFFHGNPHDRTLNLIKATATPCSAAG